MVILLGTYDKKVLYVVERMAFVMQVQKKELELEKDSAYQRE